MKSLNKCINCKYNNKGYCMKYNTRAIPLQGIDYCTCFRKKTKMPIRNQIKKKSIKQEKKLAKDLGAKRVPQSGAQITSPSDMVLGKYVIESKATKNKSISLKKEWLDQLKQSPINFGKIPVLIIEFSTKDRYVIMDNKDFLKIVDIKSNKWTLESLNNLLKEHKDKYILKEDLIKEDEELQKHNNELDRIYEEDKED